VIKRLYKQVWRETIRGHLQVFCEKEWTSKRNMEAKTQLKCVGRGWPTWLTTLCLHKEKKKERDKNSKVKFL